MDTKRIIDTFIATLGSDTTKEQYALIVNKFCDEVGKNISDITSLDCSEYVNNNYNKLATSTRNMRVQVLKSFANFCFDNGICTTNFAKGIKSIRGESEPKDTLTKVEAMLMMSKGNNREVALISLLLNTGLRISEIINLKLDDYSDCMTVKTKGSKYRTIYLNEETKDAIDRYLKVRKNGSEYLFTSNLGTKLDKTSINRSWKKLAKKAGIDKHITSHSFRRTVITDVITSHGLAMAKEFIGHSNVQTTMRYYQPNESKIKDIYFR